MNNVSGQDSTENGPRDALQAQMEKVKDCVKRGQFGKDPFTEEEDLVTKVQGLEQLLEAHEKIAREDPLTYLKSKCLIAELYDYFGDFAASRAAAEGGAEVLEEIRDAVGRSLSVEEKMIVREKIRLHLAYAQASAYRNHRYQEAERQISSCRELVEALREPTFPCNGTLAQIMYYLGRVQRQTGEYDKAEYSFSKALNHYNQRAEHRSEQYQRDDDLSEDDRRRLLERELEYLRHRSAVCLALGLGWVRYTKGHLRQARALILPARIVLLSTNDVLNKAYVDLIYGSIRRCLAGREPEGLDEAIDYVVNAAEKFEKHGHGAYRARAAYELSLAYLYRQNYEEARGHLALVEEYSSAKEDHRWLARAKVIHSRIAIEEGNLTAAERLASTAREEARLDRQQTVEIDALFSRGEAMRRIGRSRYKEALQDLLEAQLVFEQTGGASPKVEGVLHLNLARLYAVLEDPRKADAHMERWKQVEGTVEHQTVHDLAAEVRGDLSKLKQHLIFRSDEPDLDYESHRKELQKWLVTQAMRRESSTTKMAELLGISRQTLYNWLDE